MSNVYIKTLGCKVNHFDSHVLENWFKKQGFTITDDIEKADISLLNTCSVTKEAEKDARYLARQFKRKNPNTICVLTGCYAQIDSANLAKIPEIDYIAPNEMKHDLVAFLQQKLDNPTEESKRNKILGDVKPVADNKQGHFKTSITVFDTPKSSQTRAFLKIQDGCNGFCTYCQIPYARGVSRSVAPHEVLRAAEELISQGTKELVLTGIHIGDFGRENEKEGEEDLSVERPITKLLRDLFQIPGLKRLRISSLEPSEVDHGMLKVLKENEEIFCDHFHLPLQSGSDRILKLMKRAYDCDGYFKTIEMIREYFPDANLTGDVICGFPSESEEDFSQNIDFIKKCGLSGLHVFPYSKRPNTAAARMPNHLEPQLIKERGQQLRELSKTISFQFLQKFLGQTHEILWENHFDSKNRQTGKTKNYLNVVHLKDTQPQGQLSNAYLKGILDHTTIAVV